MKKAKSNRTKRQNGVNNPTSVIVTDMKKKSRSDGKRVSKGVQIEISKKASGTAIPLRTPAPISYKDKQTEITGMDNNRHLIAWVYIRLISKIILPGGAVAAAITLYHILSG